MKKVYKHENGGTMIITDSNLESIMKREGFKFVKDLEPKKQEEKKEE